jgi:hypothetical protein
MLRAAEVWMRGRTVVWIAVFAVLLLALGGSIVPGWLAGVVVAAALVLSIPLSVLRYRRDRNLARAFWRALTSR